MFREIFLEALSALRRNPLRSLLTLLGIIWGIVSVSLLFAYGSGFRTVLRYTFEAFGKGAVIAWPGTTSEQAGGERAGKHVRFEAADVEAIRDEAPLVRQICRESVKFLGISHENNLASTAIRGVYPEYGEMRNEEPSDGRWISPDDMLERRRVAFLGGRLKEKLFGGAPAVGEIVRINGVRFTVIGIMERKFQDSNYFTSDDESAWIPYSAAADMWDARYASVLVFEPVAPSFEAQASDQVRAAIAKRQRFSPTDKRAITMFGREEERPIIDGITIGLEALLLFVGVLTLGIGGVGVMNIMLVSVEERYREIGLRRALGARRRHIRMQFLAESLAITLLGGVIGMALSFTIAAAISTLPFLGPAYEDASGKVDIHMQVSWLNLAISAGVLLLVGLVSGMIPAERAARLDPVEALRYE
ncbi:MAG TPA: ABC transporter permease [Candidatus Acidoferrales bacterium]|nr:ABC transporter permease [Candidatus Acidoferrales bacterium]